MNNSIFIPSKLRVGFRNRTDTYTSKLGFVIYYDQKNVLRKEVGLEGWRDKTIDPIDTPNEPTSGFVLNKKVGDYKSGWNHRQAKIRIYDPRGFEFEISVENLLYILENTSSIKGKGLEGDFVYGWDGPTLLLIPTSSPDYEGLCTYATSLANVENINRKNIVLGGTYLTNKNEEWIYLGIYPVGNYKTPNQYIFQHEDSHYAIKGLKPKIIKCISAEPVANYAELIDELEHRSYISPINPDAVEYVRYTDEEISEIEASGKWTMLYVTFNNTQLSVRAYDTRIYNNYYDIDDLRKLGRELVAQIEEIQTRENLSFIDLHQRYNFHKRNQYLANGKLYKEGWLR